MQVSGQLHVPAALPHGEDRRLGRIQNRSDAVMKTKSSVPDEKRIPVVQPDASRYTDSFPG
jgi:hypothetical protein